ncbi:hypothetical protein ACMFMG_001172 [Clarireedia jacksonii]
MIMKLISAVVAIAFTTLIAAAPVEDTDKRAISSIVSGTPMGMASSVGVSNIIIQNIAITNLNPKYVWGGDALSFSDTNNIWIDHVTQNIVLRLMRWTFLLEYGAGGVWGSHYILQKLCLLYFWPKSRTIREHTIPRREQRLVLEHRSLTRRR